MSEELRRAVWDYLDASMDHAGNITSDQDQTGLPYDRAYRRLLEVAGWPDGDEPAKQPAQTP
jgi:hypothetical protein